MTSARSRRRRSSGSERRVRPRPRTDGPSTRVPDAVGWRHGRIRRPPPDRPDDRRLPLVLGRRSRRSTATCPSCGAILLGDGEPVLPGVTAIDADDPRAREDAGRSREAGSCPGSAASTRRGRAAPGRRRRPSRRPTPRSSARSCGSRSKPRSPTCRPRPRRVASEAAVEESSLVEAGTSSRPSRRRGDRR